MFKSFREKSIALIKQYPKTFFIGALALLLGINMLGGFLIGIPPLSILVGAGIGLAVTAGALIGLSAIAAIYTRLFDSEPPSFITKSLGVLLGLGALLPTAVGAFVLAPASTATVLPTATFAMTVTALGFVGFAGGLLVLGALGLAAKFIYDNFFAPGPGSEPLFVDADVQPELSPSTDGKSAADETLNTQPGPNRTVTHTRDAERMKETDAKLSAGQTAAQGTSAAVDAVMVRTFL